MIYIFSEYESDTSSPGLSWNWNKGC